MWQIRKIKQQQQQQQKKQTITTTTKTPIEIPKDKNKNKKKQQKKNKTKQNKKKRPTSFFWMIFTCSLPVSSSKTLDRNPFTILKLYYLLSAIFSKSNCFHWVV